MGFADSGMPDALKKGVRTSHPIQAGLKPMDVGLDHQRYSTANAEIQVHWLIVAGQLAEEGADEIIQVDLSQVERITSEELSELIRLQLLVRKNGRKLVLKNVEENLRSIFELTRLTRLIEMQ
ncbi:hypothetical protein RMSM_01125 [Rhodopirellula maiorica SM1]|uniref:STAS domain-containing protein n=1 Tax=Rhodopirellula maiorica SM1 TaxID=1265738 RepID=M5RRH9_9BACT|nr:STAS domain-containing protein [Rhodopirellula maiorica]EMI21948.1 hypothetical protein RMSM_01125 [Rhodopirellula maiorica SM1]